MKKIFFSFMLPIAFFTVADAQGILDQAKKADISGLTSGFDVKSLSSGILGTLTPALGLTDTEKPSVLTEITSFLTKKKDILPLQATDKAGYASKFASLSTGFMGKMKTILTAAKYAKLLGLKPKTPSASNVLSNLFF